MNEQLVVHTPSGIVSHSKDKKYALTSTRSSTFREGRWHLVQGKSSSQDSFSSLQPQQSATLSNPRQGNCHTNVFFTYLFYIFFFIVYCSQSHDYLVCKTLATILHKTHIIIQILPDIKEGSYVFFILSPSSTPCCLRSITAFELFICSRFNNKLKTFCNKAIRKKPFFLSYVKNGVLSRQPLRACQQRCFQRNI